MVTGRLDRWPGPARLGRRRSVTDRLAPAAAAAAQPSWTGTLSEQPDWGTLSEQWGHGVCRARLAQCEEDVCERLGLQLSELSEDYFFDCLSLLSFESSYLSV
jgi:hypothetical protein